MNSAAIYKRALRRKRTYSFTLLAVALSALLAAGSAGWWRGEQEAEEEREETRVLSHVPYAEYFMQYAPEIGWDWQMLAAIAYHESRYNPRVQSPSGAKGIMQLMPRTAARFGLNDSTIWEPEDNIRAGMQFIGRLQQQFVFIDDADQRTRFVLASYNAGPAHIHDARRLTRKHGGNPYVWADVETWLRRLDDPEYYTDSLVYYGPFPPAQTVAYVHKVLHTYDRICREDEAMKNSTINQ